MKFLFDEYLSPRLVGDVATARIARILLGHALELTDFDLRLDEALLILQA